MLEHMACKPRLFIGSINWASVVPRAEVRVRVRVRV